MFIWVFMLVCDLILPLFLMFFGKSFEKNPPPEINDWFGYRTKMSKKNIDTWNFAHRYWGKITFIFGLAALPVSAALMLPVLGQSEEAVGTVGGVICFLQIAMLFITMALTERALKKNFDSEGNPKSPKKNPDCEGNPKNP